MYFLKDSVDDATAESEAADPPLHGFYSDFENDNSRDCDDTSQDGSTSEENCYSAYFF